ncbi:MAG: PHP domain-containing protein [Clostridiales bacterium]|nr:PHP domain-containing protein [Clostridiales bacterium]
MIDLHVHTTASDGSLSPALVVKEAARLGITHLGIADHDTVNGIKEALDAGKLYGVNIIPAVELGTDYEGMETHILGYFRPDNYMNINHYFKWILQKRFYRNEQMIKNLQNAGFSITIEEVMKKANKGTPGRPHIAKILIEKGYCNDINDAFNKILLREDIYIKREKTSPKSAIKEILKAGGIPVVAHPVYLEESNLFEKTISLFLTYGLKGIEVYHCDHKVYHEKKYAKVAKKYKLLMTGGSDFHGENKEGVELGSVNVPDELVIELLKELKGQ